jgi:hypothetical protein
MRRPRGTGDCGLWERGVRPLHTPSRARSDAAASLGSLEGKATTSGGARVSSTRLTGSPSALTDACACPRALALFVNRLVHVLYMKNEVNRSWSCQEDAHPYVSPVLYRNREIVPFARKELYRVTDCLFFCSGQICLVACTTWVWFVGCKTCHPAWFRKTRTVGVSSGPGSLDARNRLA